jgi:hypothetical protein
MKRALLIVTVAAGMVACNSKPQNSDARVIFADTTGLAQFQQWKAENERLAYTQYMQQQTQPKRVVTRSTSQSNTGGSMNTSTTNTAQKKGWSKAAKGAVIGGTSGAVLGAVINKKNRVVGGILGGVLGGGIGYGIGRSKDKKDGRY